MKKLVLATALLGMAGMASAFNQVTNSGGDFTTTSIIRNTLGAAPNGGTDSEVNTPGVNDRAAQIVIIDKSGSNLTLTLTPSGFNAASSDLAALGQVQPDGSIVIEGSGLQTLAQDVGVSPSDLTVKKLTIKRAGV